MKGLTLGIALLAAAGASDSCRAGLVVGSSGGAPQLFGFSSYSGFSVSQPVTHPTAVPAASVNPLETSTGVSGLVGTYTLYDPTHGTLMDVVTPGKETSPVVTPTPSVVAAAQPGTLVTEYFVSSVYGTNEGNVGALVHLATPFYVDPQGPVVPPSPTPSSPTPEPSTVVMGATAALLGAGYAWRRRKGASA